MPGGARGSKAEGGNAMKKKIAIGFELDSRSAYVSGMKIHVDGKCVGAFGDKDSVFMTLRKIEEALADQFDHFDDDDED